MRALLASTLVLSAALASPVSADALRDAAAKIERAGNHSGAPIGQGEKLYRSTLSISDDCMMTGEQRSDLRANPPSPALFRFSVPVAQIDASKVDALAADGLLIVSLRVPKDAKGFQSQVDVTKSNPMIDRIREAVQSGKEDGVCNTSGCRVTFDGGFVELAMVGKTKAQARQLTADMKTLIEICRN